MEHWSSQSIECYVLLIILATRQYRIPTRNARGTLKQLDWNKGCKLPLMYIIIVL